MKNRLLFLAIFFLHLPVFAHPGHGANFTSGLWHPISGADHLLTMLALGLWAFQMGGRARWIIPASFAVSMFAGSAIALTGIKLPYPEHAILASLVISGILLAAGAKLPLFVAALITGFFAIFHGGVVFVLLPPQGVPVIAGQDPLHEFLDAHAQAIVAGDGINAIKVLRLG